MNNKAVTPYSLPLQSVLNEFSKYAIKLTDASELGVTHSPTESGVKLNMQGLGLAQDLKSLIMTPEYEAFIRGLDQDKLRDILVGSVVLSRPHNISLGLSTYKTAYELASMSLMLRNYCYIKQGEYHKGTMHRRVYDFLVTLCGKVHNLCLKIMGHISGSIANIMSHFNNSMSHEIDSWSTKNGGSSTKTDND